MQVLQYSRLLQPLVAALLVIGLCVPGSLAEEQSLQAALTMNVPADSDAIHLVGRDARWQLVVSRDSLHDASDVTRSVSYSIEPNIAEISPSGYIVPTANGNATITAQLGELTCRAPLMVTGMDKNLPVNFPNQVVPIFTKLGCNGGGCHGKAAGQAGFKLSLLGFEPRDDYDHLLLESRGRRVFPAMPDQSLLLLKAINASPHGGGQRLEQDSHEYRVLSRWIAGGLPYGEGNDPVVTKIEITPNARRLERKQSQQLSVIATYSDGSIEDITRTAQFESNNTDLAQVDSQGFVSLGDQPGDVAIMARYQGQVAVFRASIPLGIEIKQWPLVQNAIDEAVFAKLETLGVPPSVMSDDSTLIRRVTLDICGRLPTIDETKAYLASSDADKYEQLVDRLLASDDYADYFAKKWTMILRNRRTAPGQQFGTFAFHNWLRDCFLSNRPYDQMVRDLLTASGSPDDNPPVSWWREVSNTESRVEDAAQLFLGQRLQCARCHHHPLEKWSQTDYYQMSAFFSKVARKEGPTPDAPMFVSRLGSASAQHPKSGKTLYPAGLDAEPLALDPSDDPRVYLVDWMVQPDNPFFAKSLTNRYWKHFFATGLVEPEDDLRVTNPPTNPELLTALEQSFINSGYDLKALIRLICTSSVYRFSSDANSHNLNDTNSYSRYYPKRLPAEVLLDAVDQVLMTQTSFGGMPSGTRAIQLPDTAFDSYFLDVFGRPSATTACECERSQEATLAQSLHLLNSKEIQAKLAQDSSLPAAMNASSQPTEELITDLYFAALSRSPTSEELSTATLYIAERAENKRLAYEDLVWAIINSKEFLFNH